MYSYHGKAQKQLCNPPRTVLQTHFMTSVKLEEKREKL